MFLFLEAIGKKPTRSNIPQKKIFQTTNKKSEITLFGVIPLVGISNTDTISSTGRTGTTRRSSANKRLSRTEQNDLSENDVGNNENESPGKINRRKSLLASATKNNIRQQEKVEIQIHEVIDGNERKIISSSPSKNRTPLKPANSWIRQY